MELHTQQFITSSTDSLCHLVGSCTVHTAAQLPSVFISSLGVFVQESVSLIAQIEQVIFVDLMPFTSLFMDDVSQQSCIARNLFVEEFVTPFVATEALES
jgi:hypothetical protein